MLGTTCPALPASPAARAALPFPGSPAPQGTLWDRQGIPQVAGEPLLTTGSIWSPDGPGKRSVPWGGWLGPPWSPMPFTVCHLTSATVGTPLHPQPKLPAPPHSHHACPIQPALVGRSGPLEGGYPIPLHRFPQCVRAGSLPTVPGMCWPHRHAEWCWGGCRCPAMGWALGITAASQGTERVLPVTPVAVPRHPFAPLMWAPMETPLPRKQWEVPPAHLQDAKQGVRRAVRGGS